MRICVFGAGAIGGLIATRFALVGEDVTVTVIDRDQHLAAIKSEGIKLEWHDSSVQTAKVNAVDRAADAGRHDLIVLAVKAQFLEQIASEIQHLLDHETVVMTVQNGIPWWYFQKHGGKFDGKRLRSLDPSGILTDKIDVNQIIACVVYSAAVVIAPGIIRHVEGDRFPVGELDGQETDRVKRVSDLFVRAGLKSRVLTDVRSELWLKALGTLSLNPISALTHATMVDICQFPETKRLAATMMREAQTMAEKLGITFRHTIDKRIEGAEAVGAHKTSMLQDVEDGRPLETDALMGAILEIGKLTETPSPAIESVYALVKLLEKVKGRPMLEEVKLSSSNNGVQDDKGRPQARR
jgi:ketopantoate reductase